MVTVPTVASHLPRQGETSKAKSYLDRRKACFKPSLGFFFSLSSKGAGDGAGPSVESRGLLRNLNPGLHKTTGFLGN